MAGWTHKRDGREVPIPDEATLRRWAGEGRFDPGDLIFHPDLQRWLYAQDVLEIRSAFDSAVRRAGHSARDVATPRSATQQRPASAGSAIATLASSYRQLVLWVGFQVLLCLALWLFDGLAVFAGPALIVTVLALAFYASRTAAALGSSSASLWAVAMLIPCINIFTLLVLSSKATEVCRANGIAVGFLGPRV